MKMKISGGDLLDMTSAVKVSRSNEQEALMILKDNRWMVKSAGPADVLMSAILMPAEAMESYERRGYDEIGLNTEAIDNFVSSRNDTITLEMEDRALHMDDGDTHVRLATIIPEQVAGATRSAPDVDYEITINNSPDFIKDFIKRAEEVVGASHYYMGAREDGFYLYAPHDNGSIDRRIEWDEFDGHELNWEVNNEGPNDAHTPKEDKAVDVIMGTDFTNSMKAIEDEGVINIGNHFPMRWLFDKSEEGEPGMKVTFIQTPRVNNDQENVIPQKIIDKY